MPLLRMKEIRDMPVEERTKKLGEFRTELLRMKTMIKAGGTVESPARIRQVRRVIAKMLTVEREEKLGLIRAKPKEKKKEKKKK